MAGRRESATHRHRHRHSHSHRHRHRHRHRERQRQREGRGAHQQHGDERKVPRCVKLSTRCRHQRLSPFLVPPRVQVSSTSQHDRLARAHKLREELARRERQHRAALDRRWIVPRQRISCRTAASGAAVPAASSRGRRSAHRTICVVNVPTSVVRSSGVFDVLDVVRGGSSLRRRWSAGSSISAGSSGDSGSSRSSSCACVCACVCGALPGARDGVEPRS